MKRPELKVSEWVNLQQSWPLFNHAGETVGSIAGGITVSHFGSTLNAHLPKVIRTYIYRNSFKTRTLIDELVEDQQVDGTSPIQPVPSKSPGVDTKATSPR